MNKIKRQANQEIKRRIEILQDAPNLCKHLKQWSKLLKAKDIELKDFAVLAREID